MPSSSFGFFCCVIFLIFLSFLSPFSFGLNILSSVSIRRFRWHLLFTLMIIYVKKTTLLLFDTFVCLSLKSRHGLLSLYALYVYRNLLPRDTASYFLPYKNKTKLNVCVCVYMFSSFHHLIITKITLIFVYLCVIHLLVLNIVDFSVVWYLYILLLYFFFVYAILFLF